MSTYQGETAANLTAALESLYAQTEAPMEIVLVVDGPVGPDQESVIAQYQKDGRIRHLELLRLETTQGLALALNAGLRRCKGVFVARMDSDDISFPERFEEQWRILMEDPHVDVVGSWSAEFRDNPMIVTGMKTPPEHHEEIKRALTWNCALVHPSILIRKRNIEEIGGYRPFFGDYADYDLYVRLMLLGARFYMVQRPLVRYRTSFAQRRRRSGVRYAFDEINLRFFFYRSGFLSLSKFLLITPIYCLYRLTPPSAKEYLYPLVRRRAVV
jgi:glycosyltransferase involved in cell wall biosynthesis